MAPKKGKQVMDEVDLATNVFLLSQMRCVVCESYMQSPIVQCITGHSICKTCAEKSSTCVRCGKAITRTRNLHLENMAIKVKYPCHNAEAGCKMMFSYDELKQHEKRCGNRVYICKLGIHCPWVGRRNDLPRHVKSDHDEEIVMEKSANIRYKNFKNAEGFFTRLVKAFGEVFWYHHLKTPSAVHWAIQYLGPDVKARSFVFNFKIISPEDGEKYVGFKNVPCLDSTEIVSDAFENAKCVKVNLDVVRNFEDEEGNIIYKLELKKHKQVEVKTDKEKKKKEVSERSSDL